MQDLPPNHILTVIPRFQILQFMWKGYRLIRYYDPLNPYFHLDHCVPYIKWKKPPTHIVTANVTEVHGVLISMSRILYDWPNSWYLFLRRLITKEAVNTFDMFPLTLREMFDDEKWLWVHKSWMQFVHSHMFDNSLLVPWLRYYNEMEERISPNVKSILTQKRASQLLGVSEVRIKKFVDRGQLRATARPESVERIWQYVDADSVERLRKRRSMFLSITELSQLLDISRHQIVKLVGSGLLEAEHGALVDKHPVWSFDPEIIERNIRTLIGHVPVKSPDPENEDIYSFEQVFSYIVKHIKTLSGLLLDIRKGELPAYRCVDDLRFGILWFDQKEFLRYRRSQTRLYDHIYDRKIISLYRACQMLKCNPKTLQKLYKAGILIPRIDNTSPQQLQYLYYREDIYTFLENHITAREAAKILGITKTTLQKWCRRGRIQAVSGPTIDDAHMYRFDKHYITTWRQERLQFGQVLEILGISRATLHRWIKNNHIKPIADMGGKQRWFWSKEVLKLKLLRDYSVDDDSSEDEGSVVI